MTAPDLKTTWEDYYAATSGDTVLKDRNFFRMELEALRVAVLEALAKAPGGSLRVVELGSGAGALARVLLEALPADLRQRVHYSGIDFSSAAVERATAQAIPGASFVESDFLEYLEAAEPIDLLIAQRSIMAVIDPGAQRRLLQLIAGRLAPGGRVVLSEGIEQAQTRIDAMREKLGIGRMDPIWHCRYLDEGDVRAALPGATMTDFASQYWFITRVVYPFAADPQHNTPLHDLAAELPQTGDFGLVKLIVAERPQS